MSLHALDSEKWQNSAIYVVRRGFRAQLIKELKGIQSEQADLIVAKKNQKPAFARDIWYDPQLMRIASINDAARKLKAIQPFWYVHPVFYARRSILIEKALPHYRQYSPQSFPPQRLPNMGVFSLLDQHTLLYSVSREKPVPDGQFQFCEDKINPPNRAYLKLWEALSLLGRYPGDNDMAIDLGAAPGGWSYVLHAQGAYVWAIDKAPLARAIARLPRVYPSQQSAFALKPADFDRVDWLVGDIACYPAKLYHWLQPWLQCNKVKQFILTLKLQGQTDLPMIRKFQNIPDSRVLQLASNKHEVTWFHPWRNNPFNAHFADY
jgi:23S rRNA (cytidine2498-2'-O)-methyltransferase